MKTIGNFNSLALESPSHFNAYGVVKSYVTYQEIHSSLIEFSIAQYWDNSYKIFMTFNDIDVSWVKTLFLEQKTSASIDKNGQTLVFEFKPHDIVPFKDFISNTRVLLGPSHGAFLLSIEENEYATINHQMLTSDHISLSLFKPIARIVSLTGSSFRSNATTPADDNSPRFRSDSLITHPSAILGMYSVSSPEVTETNNKEETSIGSKRSRQ